MKKTIIGLVIATLFFTTASYVFAQVRPDQNEARVFSVKPGETVTHKVSVDNIGTTPIRVKASFEDFVYVKPFDGLKELKPLGSTKRSCGKWMIVNPAEFELGPGATQTVNCEIKVPADAKGGYNAVLFFEKLSDAVSQEGMGLTLRMGVPFFVQTINKTHNIALEDLSFTSKNVRGQLHNAGDTFIISEPSFYVMDAAGIVVDRGKIKKVYMPEQTWVPLLIKFSKEISKGKYNLVVSFDLEGEPALIKESEFTIE